ncbi:hypothetical protein BD410DRAFT_789696 [Rickenella mellea]|uniref:J domain-containing protein n=1 Tax=Rickenella mellea TaxID=50990 RepID=A0A4Y7Q2C3_9AGAM|nr:hypothetical protein BD410DRAFT_789696 [Rickenella mellea]
MVTKHASVSEAYEILGLEQESTLEEVKSAYKQLALLHHPDKNKDKPEATSKFQEIGAAYQTLVKHFDRINNPRPQRPFPFGGPFGPPEDDKYYYGSDDDDSSDDGLGFYVFIFEEFIHRGRTFAYRPRAHYRRPPTPETEEQYQARLRRTREEQKAAEERRIKGEELRKAAAKERAEKEKREAEERREAKSRKKKAKAEASRQTAAERIKAQQERTQTLRSAVFAAARRGDAEKVKNGVWEDSVDAAGGELKPGCEAFLKQAPKDGAQTLLHIAAYNGDEVLVEWLDKHNAEPEERDSNGLTAFHVALRRGFIPIVRYFMQNYPPKEAEFRAIYKHINNNTNNLRLALDSREPELVWTVLENKLANQARLEEAWKWVCSPQGVRAMTTPSTTTAKGTGGGEERARYEEMRDLLMNFGNFPESPPMQTLSVPGTERDVHSTQAKRKPSPVSTEAVTLEEVEDVEQNPTPKSTPPPPERRERKKHERQSRMSPNRDHQHQHQYPNHPHPHSQQPQHQQEETPRVSEIRQQPTPPHGPSDLPSPVEGEKTFGFPPRGSVRGRGRGGGRGSIRGRGRGRGGS